MPNDNTLMDAFGALAAKYGPGLAGSILSMRFMPAGATVLDRTSAAIGGFVAAVQVAPAIIDWAAVTSPRLGGGIEFLVGLFGMAVVGELTAAIREVHFSDLVSAWVRKRLGLPPEDSK